MDQCLEIYEKMAENTYVYPFECAKEKIPLIEKSHTAHNNTFGMKYQIYSRKILSKPMLKSKFFSYFSNADIEVA